MNSNLYALSTANGKATLIGPTGVTGIGSMVYEDGVLYAGVTQPNPGIYSLSTTTGTGTRVSTPSGSPSPGHLWGMVPANPQTGAISLITTRSGVCANDLITWGQLPAPVTTVPTPVIITSNDGVPATLTANAGPVFSDEQASGFWNGNFGAGDFLVGTGGTVAVSPIQITFPTPVWAVGAQMGYGSNGSFLAGISVFGPGNVLLGSYDVSGTESSAGDNSAPFIGVLDVMGGISAVEFFTLSTFGTPAGEFAINETSLNTAGSALVASSGSPQSALVNTAFATPLTVTLTDPCGAPLNGATVSFAAPTSGASATLSAGTAVTAGNGTASVTASANGTAGSYVVTASVFGHSATFSLTNTPEDPPVITTSSLPAGFVGSAYSATLAATGGTPPYTKWAVASGTLPAGLKLNAATGEIRGTPSSSAGSPFSFSITVEDSAGDISAPAPFSVTINPPVSASSVHLSHSTAVGGTMTTDNYVILTGPAPSGGVTVTLTSSNPPWLPSRRL